MDLEDQYDWMTWTPKKGWEGNIMAERDGKVWEKDIEEILRIHKPPFGWY